MRCARGVNDAGKTPKQGAQELNKKGDKMKSAYTVLGIPGNASTQEIEASYIKSTQYYSHERLLSDESALDRFAEIKGAYKLLTNPEFRAAHDRKLSASVNRPASTPRVIVVEQATPWFSKPLNLMALLVVILFATGGYMSYSRQQVKKEQVAFELAQKKLEAEAAQLAQKQQAQADAEQVRKAAESERKERQFRAESNYAASRASAVYSQQEAQASRQMENDRRNLQQQARDAKNEERQRVYDAERRVAADKQRVRELCYQNYRRPDC
jgi:curved DNA-binding protein CbpA